MATLDVHYLPQFVAEADLAGEVVVVIDQLRASSTICQALASGAADVTAFLEVGEAVRAAQQLRNHEAGAEVLLGGERGGKRIDGFDLGNSPTEYTPDRVFGRRLFFTTTNGTMALRHTRLARRVLVGSALNLGRVVAELRGEQYAHILCAGTNGHVSRDDQLIAGAIAHGLAEAPGQPREGNPAADAVVREWQELLTTARALGRTAADQLAIELRDTPGGKNLIEIGMDGDLAVCAEIDALRVLPVYDPGSGRVTAG
jgi:2-phosphosulfolactate phosphatase